MGSLSRGPRDNVKPAKVIDQPKVKESPPPNVMPVDADLDEAAFGKKKQQKNPSQN